MKHFIFLLLLLPALAGFSQNGFFSNAGARGLAMGQTGLCLTDINSAYSNPAGLAQLPGLSFQAMAEQRFMVQNIRLAAAAAALPTASGTFGLSLHYYGFEEYNEQRIGLIYARRLLDKLSIGAQFLALNTRIPEYGNKAVYTFELGLLSALLPELSLGVRLYSPIQIELNGDERLPTVLNIGLAYHPSTKVTLNAEVEKDIDFEARGKFGLEYQLADPLFIRLGVATNPGSMSFGFGLAITDKLYFDLASSYHQVLGFTPAFGITYQKIKQ